MPTSRVSNPFQGAQRGVMSWRGSDEILYLQEQRARGISQTAGLTQHATNN
jgi:hypothetical protein